MRNPERCTIIVGLDHRDPGFIEDREVISDAFSEYSLGRYERFVSQFYLFGAYHFKIPKRELGDFHLDFIKLDSVVYIHAFEGELSDGDIRSLSSIRDEIRRIESNH